MNAIILCGGLSTRLKDITKNTPKVLLDIKGKTVLDWQLEKLKELEIKEVVLAAGHLADVLKEQIGEERNGMKLIYAIEKERLGTGGAIKFAWEHVSEPDAPVVVLNGDVLTTDSLKPMAEKLRKDSEGIIFGAKVEDASSYGTLKYDKNDRLLAFKEKEGVKCSAHINGGVYLFTSAARRHFPQESAFSIEYDVFPKMKDLDIYRSEHPWIDIGLPERLFWARENWSE
ncbi:MAG: D-glycero-D-manno-heptose 1-phosphate guanosyltransferase [Candidatus Magasanikbacteria bacterium CG10_big_fil_rev_8_21_14_0_10_36_32]|uniref:D-glycero-D-manno-heptose 1-phosphate guanosyltransferase n=1 Tax=Candidatus Magasanikbacteria bacterium CG10_big_fil_rev_8_21_14_0_10_36_32 TaxID=1974646 RepID=A0A2M6W6F8_9BACT|nr:MAG: D-glycero-D-manno-heptose 1-phosphate guanosyltransferase [Candidatus Magasanikbacteria bacterium CG10_big_fil_rev_8_21_14_0_10_36_32]